MCTLAQDVGFYYIWGQPGWVLEISWSKMRQPAQGQEEGPPGAMLPWPLGPLRDTCHTWSRAAAAPSGWRSGPIPPLRLRTRASPCSPSPPRGSPLPFLSAREPHADIATARPSWTSRIISFSSLRAGPERPSPRSPRHSRVPRPAESAARVRPCVGPSVGAAVRLCVRCFQPPRFLRRTAFFFSL